MAVNTTQGIVLAVFGASAGGHLSALDEIATTQGGAALASTLSATAGLILGVDLSDDAAFTARVLSNLGIEEGTDGYTLASNYFTTNLAAGGDRGALVSAGVEYLLGDNVDASLATAATTFTTTVADAVTYSQGEGATVFGVAELIAQQSGSEPEIPAGASFILTDEVDDLTGDADNNTFEADLLTVNDDDSVDGGEGSDTLNMTINAAVTSDFNTTSVETINVTSYGDQTLDMTNIDGAEVINTVGSTGKLSVNKITSADLKAGFAGNSTNSITLDHTAGVLSGTSDTLGVVLNSAEGVVLTSGPGFETISIDATGDNDITTLTVPGVTSYVFTGSGSVNAKDQMTLVTTVDATAMSGALTTGTANSSTGIVNQEITAATTGSTLLLGTGDDNIGFNSTGATSGSTVLANDGNDIIQINAAGTGAVIVFAEDGDDTISAVTSALASTDVLDGGDGTDTVRLDGSAANNGMVLRSIENITITAGTATQTLTADDSASVITFEAADNSSIDLANLTAGSTVTVNEASSFSGSVDALTVGFEAKEAASTIDVNAAIDGAMATSKITAVTLDFAEAVVATTGTIATTDATSLDINAAKGFARSTIEATDDKLTSLTIDGANAVTTTTIGAANTNKLATVDISAAKALQTTTIGTDSTKLADVTLTSTGSTVTATTIGQATNTATLNVTATGDGNVQTGAIVSTKVGNITGTATDGTVTIGAVGSDATAIGNINLTASGNASVGLIGNATPAATSVGNITMSSTKGSVILADTGSIDVKDSGGIDLSFTAKTNIGNAAGNRTNVALVENTGGDINATLAGTAQATLDLKAITSGEVNLTATNTGGTDIIMTNAGTAGEGQTSTVSLGNAKSGTSNKVEVAGTVDTLNVTGGTGVDNVILSAAQNLVDGSISLGTGSDILSFAGTSTVGVAVNLGSTTVTFSDTGSTQVSASTAVGYDAGSASAKVVSTADGFTLGVSGVSEIVGTAQKDYVVANAEGTKITGGAEADTLILGAGTDNVVYAGTNATTLKAEAGTNYNDTIESFTSGTDTFTFDADTVSASAGTGYQEATSGIALATDKVNFVSSTEATINSATEVADHLADFADTTAANTDIIFAVTDGTDSAIWFYEGTSADVTVAAADLTLIAIVEGVTDFAAGDFILS